MDTTSLLNIEDMFRIIGRGLVLVPELPEPTMGGFRPFNDRVLVYKPNGDTKEFKAQIIMEHFSLVGGGKWRIIVLLPDASYPDVPKGSQLKLSNDALAIVRRVIGT